MQVRSLGRKDPWRRAWQPPPVFLPGESPWTEEPGGLQSIGLHSQTRFSTHTVVSTESIALILSKRCFPSVLNGCNKRIGYARCLQRLQNVIPVKCLAQKKVLNTC